MKSSKTYKILIKDEKDVGGSELNSNRWFAVDL
jgi:hypothetical protein